ncbi:MAG: hypothetical protein FWG02_08925 [Holophagaceae bacterium]|nr:hypothetical protein [Holophagaceae bacterium]
MISLLLVIAIQTTPSQEGLEPKSTAQQVQGQEQTERPRPPTYYWRDRAGQMKITTSVPPPNATIIRVVRDQVLVIEEEFEEIEVRPTPEEIRAEMEVAFDEKTVLYWHNVDDSFYKARLSSNTQELSNTMNTLFQDSLWGNGIWILIFLPFVIMAISMLLAWMTCYTIRSTRLATKSLVWILFTLASASCAHVVLQYTLHRPQAKRIDFMLSMIPHYLGGYIEAKPDNLQAIRLHIDNLLEATEPTIPFWVFLQELDATKQTLDQVVLDP